MDISINVKTPDPFIEINGERASFQDGIKLILKYKCWSRSDMAHYLKVSPRTVDGWVNGRKPNNSALIALSYMLI